MANKRIEDLIFAKVKGRVDAFRGLKAQAGFMPSAQYEGQAGKGTPVAYVAAIQEYGDPSHGIPPRPFMRKASSDNREEWVQSVKRGLREVVRGGMAPDAALEAVGGVMAADIQGAIAAVDSPPLSPVTLMLRGMRQANPNLVVTGRTVGEAAAKVAAGDDPGAVSTKPLVDTGYLLASVTHRVGKSK